MGLFDWITGGDSDEAVGERLLTAYYEEASKFSGFNYPSYDAWVAYLNSKVPGFVTDVGNLVNINYASTTVDQAEDRLIQLANETAGEASMSKITMEAGGHGDTVNWAAAIPEVGYETVTDAAQYTSDTLQDVGSGAMSTLKLVKYLPWILGGAGALYIVFLAKSTGNQAGRGIRTLSEAAASRIRKNPSNSNVRALYDQLVEHLSLSQFIELMGGEMSYKSKALRAKKVSKSKKVHELADKILALS